MYVSAEAPLCDSRIELLWSHVSLFSFFPSLVYNLLWTDIKRELEPEQRLMLVPPVCDRFHLFSCLSDPLYTLSSEKDHSKANIQLIGDKLVGVGQR